MRNSNYDKKPNVSVEGELIRGWGKIVEIVNVRRQASLNRHFLCVIECYQGVYMATTEIIPMIVTSANERMAGCLAKISIPMPINIISEESIMLFLYDASIFLR